MSLDGESSNNSSGTLIYECTHKDTANPPVYGLLDATRNVTERYVIAMVDLDAVNETVSEERNFLGGNFQLGTIDDNGFGQLKNTTAAITEYTPPNPPAGDGPHRYAVPLHTCVTQLTLLCLHSYAFFIFAQSGLFDFQTDVNDTTPTSNFNLSQFVAEIGLGNPIGGTYVLV